jgi:hypothetical protein
MSVLNLVSDFVKCNHSIGLIFVLDILKRIAKEIARIIVYYSRCPCPL